MTTLHFLQVTLFTSSSIAVLASSPPLVTLFPVGGYYIDPPTLFVAEPPSREIYAFLAEDKMQGRIIPGYTGVEVRSLVDCLILCGVDYGCMSIFYQSQSRTCYKHSIVFISYRDTESSDDTSYYVVGTNDCPVEQGYFHKRNFGLCYRIVKDSANATSAARTCDGLNGTFGITFDEEMYNHLMEEFEGSFILRQRKFWVGLGYSDLKGEFVFSSQDAPAFGRWLANNGTTNEGTTVQPDGVAGQCVVTDRETNWNWDVIDCNKKRAYVCGYQHPSQFSDPEEEVGTIEIGKR